MNYLILFLVHVIFVRTTVVNAAQQQSFSAGPDSSRKDYSDYSLLRCMAKNGSAINFERDNLWMKNEDYMEFMAHNDDLEAYIDCKNLGNVQEIIDEELNLMFVDDDNEDTFDVDVFKNTGELKDLVTFSKDNNPFFKRYHNLEEIYEYMEGLAYKYANLVRLEDIGTTYEGRDLKAMHISAHDPIEYKNPVPKKTIVITSGLHAREWATITTTLWIATKLASKYGTYKKETRYLENLDFFIIPVFNPDGYEYTWNDDRLWRKTRQQTYHPRCFGIDLDHSFDFKWRDNDTPCSASYSGSSPFESLESKLLNDYLFEKKNSAPDFKLHGFIDFHSYGQEILYPYGFSCDLQPRDLENLLELSYGMSRSIRLKSGETYSVMPSCKDRGSDLIPGFGSGNALDYMYHSKAYWAFQIKIRDLGEKGFILPKKYIKPVGRENYAAVKHFCDFILNPEL